VVNWVRNDLAGGGFGMANAIWTLLIGATFAVIGITFFVRPMILAKANRLPERAWRYLVGGKRRVRWRYELSDRREWGLGLAALGVDGIRP
jgi:hypothetical protein